MFLHATCLAINDHGVLLVGPSGIGKSDLALRLIDVGAELVSDDQTELLNDGQCLIASPPSTLAGLLEVRGVGLMRYSYRAGVNVSHYIELVDDPALIERMPSACVYSLLDYELPAFKLLARAASAPNIVCAIVKGTMAQNV